MNLTVMNLTSKAYLLIAIMCMPAPALADVVLPSIDDKFISIQEVNPTKDAGYVVGDVLERTIHLTIKKPYELVKESLPIVGYEHRWKGQISGIELTKITTTETKQAESVTHTLHLSYQVFTTGRTAKPSALRSEILKLRNTQNKRIVQYQIPTFTFRISPLSVIGQIKLEQEMSPFVNPILLDASKDTLHLKLFLALLAVSLLGLLYIFGINAWLPRMGAPFAKAYRDIRKLPDTELGLQQSIALIHNALNRTAGTNIFQNNVDKFFLSKPNYLPIKQEFEEFFKLSAYAFFDSKISLETKETSKNWLLKFCRHCRDCERGLKPEVSN